MDNDKIKRWHPFSYKFVSYDGKNYEMTFTCPDCGGHNCEKLGELDNDNFWSGHYRCTDCGATKENGKPINYYSDAFIRKEVKPDGVQMELFQPTLF